MHNGYCARAKLGEFPEFERCERRHYSTVSAISDLAHCLELYNLCTCSISRNHRTCSSGSSLAAAARSASRRRGRTPMRAGTRASSAHAWLKPSSARGVTSCARAGELCIASRASADEVSNGTVAVASKRWASAAAAAGDEAVARTSRAGGRSSEPCSNGSLSKLRRRPTRRFWVQGELLEPRPTPAAGWNSVDRPCCFV